MKFSTLQKIHELLVAEADEAADLFHAKEEMLSEALRNNVNDSVDTLKHRTGYAKAEQRYDAAFDALRDFERQEF